MEVLAAEGSNSSDGPKESEKPAVKMNGDVNGSIEGMEVDEDSDGGSDESVCGSSRVNMPDDDSKPNSRFGSELDGKSNSHFESEGEGKSNSHFGSEFDAKSSGQPETMDVDRLGEEDGHSVDSEEEDHLLNSDNDKDQEDVEDDAHESKDSSPLDGEMDADTEGDEEEGDVNEEADREQEKRPEERQGIKDSKEPSESGDKDGVEPIDGSEDDEEEGEDGSGDGEKGENTPKKKNSPVDLNVTPRRSSRTVQRPVRFGQENALDSEEDINEENDSDGLEEVSPIDPLADPLIDKENRRYPRMVGNTTIVVNDAKRLADIAAQKNAAAQQKKEPTLVIIDTNSILSGRGAVPIQTPGGVTITQTSSKQYPPQQIQYQPKPKPPQILPTLTDDMYVVEAPSFIVPYVYEKPPVKKLNRYLRKMLKQIRKQEDEKDEEEAAAIKKEVKLEQDTSAEGKKDMEVDVDETDLNSIKKEIVDTKEVSEESEKEKPENKDTSSEPSEKEIAESKGDEEMPEDKDKEKDDASKTEEKMEVDDKEKEPVVAEEKDAVESKVKEQEPECEEKGKDVDSKPDKEKKEIATKTVAKPPQEEVSSDSEDEAADEEEEKKKPPSTGSYFSNPLGKFFMQIGMNLVQEFVQADLLKQQKKKQKMGKGTEETQAAIVSLKKNLQMSRENNEPYTMEQTKCEFCSFKTESKLVMAHHLETPHMRNYVYRCNFCPLEVRGPHDILLHMEKEHCVRGRLERAPAFHQCTQCPFEDNQKGKLTRHLLTCLKKYRPEKNLEPPLDWEPPAKIPRVPRKPSNMPLNVNNPLYQQAMAAKNIPQALIPKMGAGIPGSPNAMMRPRGRPSYNPVPPGPLPKMMGNRAPMPPSLTRANMMYRPQAASPVVIPGSYQISGNQLFQVVGAQGHHMMNVPGAPPALQRLGAPIPSQQKANPATVKLLNQPSISITPLPRQSANPQAGIPPSRQQPAPSTSKTTFVICEICDGYIKDLEQLRNHMQWIHKVKIHPKMIYNRPPLNCQKCQFRFFTDQGLERHLLGSHGLVTSSMQDSANKGKDGGRCPVCGRVYQWKLLNHVARDHNMTLKPAHLSYKCTVCTATFGMYKQFESHVYSAHSVVAKRVMEKKNGQAPAAANQAQRTDAAQLLKPYKINNEITIIPQPAKKPAQAQQQRPVPGNYRAGAPPPPKVRGPDSVQVIDLEDSPNKNEENGGAESLSAVKERLRRRKSLEIRQLESEPDGDGSDSDEDEAAPEQGKQSEPEDDQDSEPESDG